MAIVWPCPLAVDAYAAAGRDLGFPRPDCPSCAGPLVFWSGYRRYVREAGRYWKIFVPRLQCGMSGALLPAFTLAWRLDGPRPSARWSGEVVAGGGAGPPGGGAGGVPYAAACGWVGRFRARAAELGVAFAAVPVELGGKRSRPGRGGPVRADCDRRRVRRGREPAGMGPTGRVAVRLSDDRRQADRRQHSLALVLGRLAAVTY